MKLTIKVLKGQDITLDVESDTTFLDIKKQIEEKLNIPATNQKLLLLGRTLSDEAKVSNYNIKDGAKLNLVVMKPDGLKLKDVIHRSFRKYFNETQSQLLTKEFMDNTEKTLQNMSLDDIERLADNLISV